MTRGGGRRAVVLACLLSGVAPAARAQATAQPAVPAVRVDLERVEASTANGTTRLRVDSRARFRFEPATGLLASEGSFVAQYVLGPSQIVRLGHQFEDLRLEPGQPPAARSYACIEGSFGASVGANLCGNYLFGPDGVDDGGFGDDIHQGRPKSLEDFVVADRRWDGRKLVVVLDAVDPGAAVFPEKRLELTFSKE